MDLTAILHEGISWIQLPQVTVNMAMNFKIRVLLNQLSKCKACPSESVTEVGAPLFPAVELCDFSGRWQCISGEIWYTLDRGSVLLIETEAR